MKLPTHAIAAACVLLVAACGGNDASQPSTGPDAPVPAAATPLLLGSEAVYFIDSGGAYHYSTLRQDKPESDGYTAFSSNHADEDGLQPPNIDYKLTKDGWILSENALGIRLDDNGATLTFRDRRDGSVTRAQYRKIDVSGKLVTSYLSDYFTYHQNDLEPAFGGYSIIGADALPAFNEIDGKVVQGYFLPAVTTLPPDSEMRAGYLLNPTAWNYVKARLPIK